MAATLIPRLQRRLHPALMRVRSPLHHCTLPMAENQARMRQQQTIDGSSRFRI